MLLFSPETSVLLRYQQRKSFEENNTYRKGDAWQVMADKPGHRRWATQCISKQCFSWNSRFRPFQGFAFALISIKNQPFIGVMKAKRDGRIELFYRCNES
jgi:hypothetical protein